MLSLPSRPQWYPQSSRYSSFFFSVMSDLFLDWLYYLCLSWSLPSSGLLTISRRGSRGRGRHEPVCLSRRCDEGPGVRGRLERGSLWRKQGVEVEEIQIAPPFPRYGIAKAAAWLSVCFHFPGSKVGVSYAEPGNASPLLAVCGPGRHLISPPLPLPTPPFPSPHLCLAL